MDASGDSADCTDVPLPTGGRALLRPIRPDDAPRLQALFARLSPESRHRRFFSHRRALPATEAARFAQVDARTRLAMVAERSTPAGPQLIGVARCDVDPQQPQTASLAMVVEDQFQHAGLGRALLACLAAAALAQGITHFAGAVLASNAPVLAFLRQFGCAVTLTQHGTETHFRADIASTLRP